MKILIAAVALACFGVGAHATTSSSTQPDAASSVAATSTEPSPKLQWAWGIRYVVSDLRDANAPRRFRPALAMRWGRFSFGTVDIESFAGDAVKLGGTSMNYSAVESRDFSLNFGARLHNFRTGSGIDVLAHGPRTVRLRASMNQRLDADWSVFVESTLDALGKGDGISSTAGLGRTLWRGDDHVLLASGGLKWANRSHWRSSGLGGATPELRANADVGASVGEANIGLSLRGSLDKQWAHQLGIGTSAPVGQLRHAIGARPITGLQWSVQRFSGP